jgi:FkbM family methyltransferase
VIILSEELTWDARHGLWHREQDTEVLREVWGSYKRLPIRLDDVCLDLGAHIGAAALFMLQKGAQFVCCVEPDPSNCSLLEKNLEGLPYELRRGAVGPTQGEATLYIHPTKRCRNDTVKAVRGAQELIVPQFAFDDLLSEMRPSVLKCDVEFQEHYLPSLHSLPRHVRAIQIEVHLRCGSVEETAHYRFNGRAILNSFESQGFRLIYQNEKRAPYTPVPDDGTQFSPYATAHESTWER